VVPRILLRVALVVGLGIAVVAASGASAATAASWPSNYCGASNAVFRYPRPFIGLADVDVDVGTEQFRNCSLGGMAAAGIGYFRAGIDWRYVEVQPNQYYFADYDRLVADVARHHMRLLPFLIGAPSWRSTAPAVGARPGYYPPASPSEFAYFASVLVRRYGPGGAFWRANPDLPYYPVQTWQVWNEPDLPLSWEPAPNMEAYVALLRATYVAIKGADSRAVVVSAGMPFYGDSDETHFISNMYNYGARRYFDALAIHAYSATVAQAIERLTTARRLMNHFGDARKPLWVTEFSWAGGDPDAFKASLPGQRKNLSRFLQFVRQNRGHLRLREVMWYGWQDHIGGPGPRNWWGFHLGFFTTGGRPKPALAVLRAGARQLER
jgi:hypothetical protein